MKIPLSRHFLLQSPSFFYWIHGWKVNPLSREIDLDMDFDRIETREDVLRWLAVSFSKDAPGGWVPMANAGWVGGGSMKKTQFPDL